MDSNNLTKIRGYYSSLVGIKDIIIDLIQTRGNYLEESVVNEYEEFVTDVNNSFSNLLVPFIKDKYFSHTSIDGSEENFYNSIGISMNITRNLAILKSQTEDSNFSPVTEEKDFVFIMDKKLRDILKRDYQEIQRNIISRNWKSAIILSGGSIETILLDLLSNNNTIAVSSPKAPKEKDLTKWELNDLIIVSVEEKLVNSSVGKLSDSVRDYRNLIHPGVEIRKNIKFDSSEANISVEVLNILIRELTH